MNVFSPLEDIDAILGALAETHVHPEEARELLGLRGPGMHPRMTRFRLLLREGRG